MFPLNILKGTMFMFSVLFLNSLNGYSGLTPVDYFYYALFGVINTTVLSVTIFVSSNPFNYDYKSLGLENIKANRSKLKQYNPNFYSYWDYLSNIRFISLVDFCREKGISINTD